MGTTFEDIITKLGDLSDSVTAAETRISTLETPGPVDTGVSVSQSQLEDAASSIDDLTKRVNALAADKAPPADNANATVSNATVSNATLTNDSTGGNPK